ncbi:VWA-like domain-containing protein, partial [Rhodovulum imhoffii]|uniref:vWA domain-containing protein n=1 Tax=Rhodovulum imhoffii TaxID=365340 RepID=UPI001ED0B121
AARRWKRNCRDPRRFSAHLSGGESPAHRPVPADPDSNGPEEEGEWRQRLARALAQGRIAGAGIGALGHRIADIPEPRTPWEVVLRGLLARAVQQHPRRSHARPTRRWIALDDLARAQGRPEPAYEPGILHRTDVPKIAVGLDSSSSIDGPRLALFAAQVAGIGRRTGAEVHVLVFDTQVRRHEIMHGGDWESRILDIAFSREGGTAFGDVLEQAANLRPSAIVILTDLEAPVGPAPGRMPVIWAVPEPPSAAPPFGRVLSLER